MNELTAHCAQSTTRAPCCCWAKLVFALGVARSAPSRAVAADGGVGHASRRRFFAVAGWSLLASVAAGAAWFAAQAAAMSGLPIAEALTPETLGRVLGGTTFGHVFTVRAGLAVALAAAAHRRAAFQRWRTPVRLRARRPGGSQPGISARWPGPGTRSRGTRPRISCGSSPTSGIFSRPARGSARFPRSCPCSAARRRARPSAAAVRRFSTLGVASVAVLTASGLVNAWYQVGGVPGLVGTGYGRLLVAKLVLFAAMLGLAAINRGLATRAPCREDHDALRRLRRNAALRNRAGNRRDRHRRRARHHRSRHA